MFMLGLSVIATIASSSATDTAARPPATIAAIRWTSLGEPGCGGWLTSIAVSPHDGRFVLLGGDMLGLGLSEDGGETWGPTFGLPNWEIADVTWHPTDPREVWAGSMGGPVVSRDGGRNWKSSRSGLPTIADWAYTAPIERVLFDPSNHRRMLAFGGSHRRWQANNGEPAWGAVWESMDGGANWRRATTLTPAGEDPSPTARGTNVVSVVWSSDPLRLYAALDENGVLASQDGGRTWRPAHGGLPHRRVNRIAVHPTQPLRVFVALDNGPGGPDGRRLPGGVWRTDDGGASWRPALTELGSRSEADPNRASRYPALALAHQRPDRLITADASWSEGVVYLSEDAGGTWRRAGQRPDGAAMPAGWGMTVAAFDPHDADVAFAAGSETVIRTRDGGRTWEDVTARRSGSGWAGRGYTGWCSTAFRFDPFRPGRAILQAMDAARAWLTEDGGKSWTYPDTGGPWNGGRGASWTRGGGVWAAFGQGAFDGVGWSADGGRSWKIFAGGARGLPELGTAGQQPEDVAADPDNPRRAWVSVGGRVLATSDGGATWREVFDGPGARGLLWRTGDEVVVAYEDGLAVMERDGGVRRLGGPRGARFLAADPRGRLLATNYEAPEAGVWRWEAGSWTLLRADRQATGIAVHPRDPGRLLMITNSDPYHDVSRGTGVWASDDDGRTWHNASLGLPLLRGHVVAFDPHDPTQIVAGTAGRGFFRAVWPSRRSAVAR